MIFGKKELKRHIKNFKGWLFGYEKCVFCKDRQNWKPWLAPINISDPEEHKKITYEMPMCEDCFCSQPMNSVLNAIKADITDDNNFCRKFGAAPAYTDAELEQITNQVTQAKIKIAGVSGGTNNSD